jgi:hypothetical protein
MNGWTEVDNWPEFTVVTGILAGALTAPFAFLGPAYDAQLREFLTPAGQAAVLRFDGWLATAFSLVFGKAVPTHRRFSA